MRVMYLSTLHPSEIEKLFSLAYKILLKFAMECSLGLVCKLNFQLVSFFSNKDHKKGVSFLKKNSKRNDLVMFVPVRHPCCVHVYADKLYYKFIFVGFQWFLKGYALCSPSLGATAYLCSCNCKQTAYNKQCTPLQFFSFTA